MQSNNIDTPLSSDARPWSLLASTFVQLNNIHKVANIVNINGESFRLKDKRKAGVFSKQVKPTD